MTSILKVNNIQNSSGTTAMTIDGSSNVTFPQNATFSGSVSGITTGKVLQMQTLTETADTGTITASGNQELMNLAITPSATTSKILILAQAVIEVVGGSNSIAQSYVFRGSIASGTQIDAFYYDGNAGIASGNTHYSTINHCLVDSPSTTSATTYTVAFGRGSGATTSVRNNFGNRTMTLLEIGA